MSKQSSTSTAALRQFHANHEPVLHIPHELPSASLPSSSAAQTNSGKHLDSKLIPTAGPLNTYLTHTLPAPSQAIFNSFDSRSGPETAGTGGDFPPHTHQSGPLPLTNEQKVAGLALEAASAHKIYPSDASEHIGSPSGLARTGSLSPSHDASPSDPPSYSSPQGIREKVMQRLSDLLSAYSQPKEPSPLISPPRQLLLSAPVLQVVNASTVKDRYLFLFSDILVLAKPLVEDNLAGEPIAPTLDTRFLVKSIVELPKLKLTAQTGESIEDSVAKRKNPLLLTFVDR